MYDLAAKLHRLTLLYCTLQLPLGNIGKKKGPTVL